MINVNIKENRDRIEVLIEGHAETRICSAISALSQTLILCIVSSSKDVIETYFPRDETDKSGRTEIIFPDGIKTGNGAGFYEFFKTGIIATANTYPDEVKLKIE